MNGGTPGPQVPGMATQAELCKPLGLLGHSWAPNQGQKTITWLGRVKRAEGEGGCPEEKASASGGLGMAQVPLAPWGPCRQARGLGLLSPARACAGQVCQGALDHLSAALSQEPLSAGPAPGPPRPHTPGVQGVWGWGGVRGWS